MPKQKNANLVAFHQKEILSTANTLFTQNGISKTTMDDIAKAAGYSKSTIYNYFDSKDTIFYHLLHQEMLLMQAQLEEIASIQQDFPSFFFQVCEHLAFLHQQKPVFFDAMLQEIQLPDAKHPENHILQKIYAVGEHTNNIFIQKINAAVACGIIRQGILPIETTFVLWASIHGIITTADTKKDYIARRMHKTSNEFMNYGFHLLLQSLLNK